MEAPGGEVILLLGSLPGFTGSLKVPRATFMNRSPRVKTITASFRSFFIPLIVTLPFENVPIYSPKEKLIWPIISCGPSEGSKEGGELVNLISLMKSPTWFLFHFPGVERRGVGTSC